MNSEALVDRLLLWLAPFQEHKQAQQVEERFRKLLKERRDEGSISTEAWRLAFRLAPAAELPPLAADLDAAWFRGEVTPQQLGALCRILAEVLPTEAPRWLARWPQAWHFDHTRERAAILVALKQPEGAAACSSRPGAEAPGRPGRRSRPSICGAAWGLRPSPRPSFPPRGARRCPSGPPSPRASFPPSTND